MLLLLATARRANGCSRATTPLLQVATAAAAVALAVALAMAEAQGLKLMNNMIAGDQLVDRDRLQDVVGSYGLNLPF